MSSFLYEVSGTKWNHRVMLQLMYNWSKEWQDGVMRTETEKNRIKIKHTSENNLQHPGSRNSPLLESWWRLNFRVSPSDHLIPALNFFCGVGWKEERASVRREDLTGKVVRGKAQRAQKNTRLLPEAAGRSDPFWLSVSFQGISFAAKPPGLLPPALVGMRSQPEYSFYSFWESRF